MFTVIKRGFLFFLAHVLIDAWEIVTYITLLGWNVHRLRHIAVLLSVPLVRRIKLNIPGTMLLQILSLESWTLRATRGMSWESTFRLSCRICLFLLANNLFWIDIISVIIQYVEFLLCTRSLNFFRMPWISLISLQLILQVCWVGLLSAIAHESGLKLLFLC